MKKPPIGSAWNSVILFAILLLLQLSLSAQLQWYQNQDGQLQPNGTYGTSIRSFGTNSFIACYLWTIDNDQYTWKVSKTNTSGNELRSFFATGTTAMVETRVGRYNTVYVLLRNFPFGQNPEYILYKLNSNLEVVTQRTISFPNDYNIFNLNAFELDGADNVYLAGDGQYPDGPGFSPASFIMKTDKHLVSKWSRMDSTETSFSRVHIEDNGTVLLLEDHYSIYPNIRVSKISSNGQHAQRRTIQTDAGRMSLFSTLDQNDNLLLYGVKSVDGGAQAIYLRKISRHNGNVIYHKTHFTAPGIDLNDLKLDNSGSIFTLVTKYTGDGNQLSRISRINAATGNINWNHSIPFNEDSCVLTKLVINQQERFYAVGERRGQTYYSKGFAIRMKKNGQRDGNFPAPDSINFQRSHILMDGIIDPENRLIAMGNTNDFDTLTYSSSYFRAFAARFGNDNGGGGGCDDKDKKGNDEVVAAGRTINGTASATLIPAVTVYPNPVGNELVVSNLAREEYDQLTVYDMQGSAVLTKPVSSNTARLDVSNLAGGVYLISLRSSATRKEQNIKFIVKR